MSQGEKDKLEQIIYWSRAALGSALGAGYAALWREAWGGLLQAASIAVLFYVISYYLIRTALGEYRLQLLGGTSKISRIGIGIFFISWLFMWILVYSLFFHTG